TSLAIGNADVLSGADLNFESTSEVTLANIEAKMQ
ncbi:MAG: beta-phosphoglucomutase, partial [Leuconostoc falkenbergense]